MKFTKGMIVGSMLTAGVIMLYADGDNWNTKKIIKKGKQMIKRIGRM